MKPRTLLIGILVLGAAATCVRLGFWQISRWHQKRAINQELRRSLSAEPLAIDGPVPNLAAVERRRVELHGIYDETRQILLTGRGHDGEMGVSIVTPLMLGARLDSVSVDRDEGAAADGDSVLPVGGGAPRTAVLIERGWVPALELGAVHPRDYPEPGERTVRGIALPIASGKRGPPLRVVRSGDSLIVLSMRVLNADSVAPRFPYALAPYLVRELPGPGVPTVPRRLDPEWADEQTNVSYAIQWFIISGIILAGSAAVAWSRRRARPAIASKS